MCKISTIIQTRYAHINQASALYCKEWKFLNYQTTTTTRTTICGVNIFSDEKSLEMRKILEKNLLSRTQIHANQNHIIVYVWLWRMRRRLPIAYNSNGTALTAHTHWMAIVSCCIVIFYSEKYAPPANHQPPTTIIIITNSSKSSNKILFWILFPRSHSSFGYITNENKRKTLKSTKYTRRKDVEHLFLWDRVSIPLRFHILSNFCEFVFPLA